MWHPADMKTIFDNSNRFVAIDKPNNLAEDDLILVFIMGRSQVHIIPPTEFTEIRYEQTESSFVPSAAAYYKLATDSEPSSYTFEFNAMDYDKRIVIGRISGVDIRNPIDQNNGISSGPYSTTSIEIPGITPTEESSLLFSIGTIRVNSTVTLPPNTTEVYKFEDGGYATGGCAVEELEDISPTGTRTFTFSESDRRAGMMFNVLMLGPLYTKPATNESYLSASLNGELFGFDIEGVSEIEVFFRYRPVESNTWLETSKQILIGDDMFNTNVMGLFPGTKYEFQAVGEYDDNGIMEEIIGIPLTFNTLMLEGYLIQRKIEDGDWVNYHIIDNYETKTWDDDFAFVEDTTYRYRVRLESEVNITAWSNEVINGEVPDAIIVSSVAICDTDGMSPVISTTMVIDISVLIPTAITVADGFVPLVRIGIPGEVIVLNATSVAEAIVPVAIIVINATTIPPPADIDSTAGDIIINATQNVSILAPTSTADSEAIPLEIKTISPVATSEGVVPFIAVRVQTLHYDADTITELSDDAPVEQWGDLTGYHNDANLGYLSYDCPVYKTNQLKGKPIVRFNDNQALAIESSYSLRKNSARVFERTMIVVITLPSVTADPDPITDIPGNTWLIEWQNYWVSNIVDDDDNTQQVVSDAEVTTEPVVISIVHENTEVKMYVNGVLQQDIGTYTNLHAPGHLLQILVGRGIDETGHRSWHADLAEVIMYNYAISDQAREALEQVLMDKWLPEHTSISVSAATSDVDAGDVGLYVEGIEHVNISVTSAESDAETIIPDITSIINAIPTSPTGIITTLGIIPQIRTEQNPTVTTLPATEVEMASAIIHWSVTLPEGGGE